MSDAPDPLFHQQILASCARFKDVIALVGENGEKVSFEDIRRAAHSFARRLSAIGIEKGDVVLVCLPNSPWYPVLFLSTALLGAVMSGVNFESTKDELKFFIEASQPTVFISTTDFITEHDWLSELVTTKGIQGRVIDSVFENAADCEPVPLSPDDPVLAPFSSGTTGAPKCCLLTHRNFVFATQSLRTALFDKVLEQSSGRTLAFLPFHHASGFWALLMSLIGGCTTYIMTKFHPILMLDMIDKFEIDTVNMVPAVVRILLRMDIENRGMSLRTILCGSSALPKQTCERFLQQFPLVERFLQGYGMTELVVLSHITPIDDHLQHLGSCGKLIPGFEAKIMSDAGEEIFQPNIEGHLLLRSEAIMKFYKDGTPNLDGDDWLHTGF